MSFIFLSNTVPLLLTSKQLSLYLLKWATMHGVSAMLSPSSSILVVSCSHTWRERHAHTVWKGRVPCVYMSSILLLTCCFAKIPSPLCEMKTFLHLYTLKVTVVISSHPFIPVFFSGFLSTVFTFATAWLLTQCTTEIGACSEILLSLHD